MLFLLVLAQIKLHDIVRFSWSDFRLHTKHFNNYVVMLNSNTSCYDDLFLHQYNTQTFTDNSNKDSLFNNIS